MHYINLGILLILMGLIISFYKHSNNRTDKLSDKIDKLSGEIKKVDDKLSDKIDAGNKALTERMDRLYDILVHMGIGYREYHDKAANE